MWSAEEMLKKIVWPSYYTFWPTWWMSGCSMFPVQHRDYKLVEWLSSRLCLPPLSLGRRWRSWTGSCRAPTMTPSTACSKSMLPNVMVPNSMPTVTQRRVCSWWWHVMHIICTKESLACSMLQVSINSTMTNTVFQMIQMLVGTHALKMATDSLQLERSGPDIVVL